MDEHTSTDQGMPEGQQPEPQYMEVRLFTGEEIFWPIWEEKSAPLEVQLGCTWHRCKFCDFANDERKVFGPAEVEAKAQLLSYMMPEATRVFLLGENPLSLPFYMLSGIFDIVANRLPTVSQISMYARFDDVLNKSDEELEWLADNGLVELHIGLESGCQDVLDFMDKGIDLQQAAVVCDKLRTLGIDYSFTMITGLGGKELSTRHASESAEFLNRVQPKHVWITGLLLWPNTPLFHIEREGGFEQLTFRERAEEVRAMVSGMELTDCEFVDSTVMGEYTVKGHFPDQKQEILAAFDKILAESGGDEIPPVPTKTYQRS